MVAAGVRSLGLALTVGPLQLVATRLCGGHGALLTLLECCFGRIEPDHREALGLGFGLVRNGFAGLLVPVGMELGEAGSEGETWVRPGQADGTNGPHVDIPDLVDNMSTPPGPGWQGPSRWASATEVPLTANEDPSQPDPATAGDRSAFGDPSVSDRLDDPTSGPYRFPPPPNPITQPPQRRWGRGFALVVAGALIAVGAGVVGAVIGRQIDSDSAPPQRASEAALDVGSERDGSLARIDIAAVAAFVAPSVVTISADFQGGGLRAGTSIGTGVITTADGEILTNSHVVQDASAIRVRLAGETEPRQAELLAFDEGNDLALLRIAGDGYVPATFAHPDSLRIGDEVVAIGFALDLDGAPSVTLGIVSALDRTIVTNGGADALDGLVQTDAAISSGNSGGPLVNAVGEVIGINTAVARGDATTAASNIGFAISVGEALPIVESLRRQANGEPRQEGFLGVSLEERRDGGQGALIGGVDPNTPADVAGVQAQDIVISIDDAAVDGAAGLVAAIRDREPGDDVVLEILRDGEFLRLTVTLTTRPSG